MDPVKIDEVSNNRLCPIPTSTAGVRIQSIYVTVQSEDGLDHIFDREMRYYRNGGTSQEWIRIGVCVWAKLYKEASLFAVETTGIKFDWLDRRIANGHIGRKN